MPHKPLPVPTLATLYPPVRDHAYFSASDGIGFRPGHGAADPANRWWMAEHALLAYAEPATIERALAAHGYAVTCLADPDTNTAAYAATAADHSVLAFRGTEALTPGDSLPKLGRVATNWLTDVRVRRVPWPDAGTVHRGFAAAFSAIWPQVAAVLEPGRAWWCTGHSLGGALAALCGVRLARERHRLEAIVTFGQPRTGDAAFAAALGALPVTRVVNACDAVARLPPTPLGYEHAGTLVHLDAGRLDAYAATLRAHVAALPAMLQHGAGALTPIELIDHAPLHYAIKCHNAACDACGSAR